MTVGDGKTLIILSSLFISVASTGCCMVIPAKPVQPAFITDESPYTARLMFPYKENERIKKLKIHEYETLEKFPFSKRSICWHIKATEAIPARGFKATIGDVPRGFKQVVPEPSALFTPVSDSQYLVEIITTNRDVYYLTWWRPGSTYWRDYIR
jgi:hypothetical protein